MKNEAAPPKLPGLHGEAKSASTKLEKPKLEVATGTRKSIMEQPAKPVPKAMFEKEVIVVWVVRIDGTENCKLMVDPATPRSEL